MIVGCLVWYDESPTWLMSTVTSLEPALDHLVAVDGAYALFPGALAHPRGAASKVEQSLAITEACAAARIPLTLHRPIEPFYGNEVEKRNLSLKLALAVTTSPRDWLLIFDADTPARYVADDFKAQLEAQPETTLVATYGVCDPTDVQAVHDKHGAVAGYEPGTIEKHPCIYRALRTITFGPAHWNISVTRKVRGTSDEVERLWLRGNPQLHKPLVSPFDASNLLRLDHRNRERTTIRDARAKDYYKRRDAAGVETGDLPK